MKRDINIFWYLIPIALIVTGSFIEGGLLRATFVAGGLFLLGAACLTNLRRCGRIHCMITGPVFILLGVLVLLAFLDILPLSNTILQLILVGGLVAGFGAEFFYRRKHGTCYIRD